MKFKSGDFFKSKNNYSQERFIIMQKNEGSYYYISLTEEKSEVHIWYEGLSSEDSYIKIK